MGTKNEEGQKLATELGHGVVYNGPQFSEGQFVFHVFTDEQVTGTVFVARTLMEAKAALMESRQLSGAPPVAFPEILDPRGILNAFDRDLQHPCVGCRVGCGGCGAIAKGTPENLPPGWKIRRYRGGHDYRCPNCQKKRRKT